MTWFATLLNRYKKTAFRRQLAVLFALGVFLVSLFSALATSWQSSRQMQEVRTRDGLRIAQGLAAQSRLALAFSSTENVSEAIAATSAFPDITRIEIRHADGRLLLERGISSLPGVRHDNPTALDRYPHVEAETSDGWRFVAPVWTKVESRNPFDATERQDELLGFVRIDQSKATLKKLTREVFIVNFSVGIILSLLLIAALRVLARRLTRPLSDLSETMARAEKGESGLRAKLNGPRDLAEMAHAFNSMMEALEHREQELRSARDSALRFAKLKADFAATVSHEIRTPLNGVIGALDMVKNGHLTKEQAELLGMAWDSSQYLLELINNILDFSRLEAGRMDVDACDFRLDTLIYNVIHMLRPQAEGKGITLSSLVAATLPPVLRGDPSRIRQVLINLVGNAIKFTGDGSVTLEASEKNGMLSFAVRDTGVGIPAEQLASIFDSFTQADPSTTRRFGGSGLGLAICKQIVRLLGGEIGVNSTPGQGSCFWFTVPLQAGLATIADEPELPGQRLRNARILIVEDNTTNQLVAAGMLRLQGCTSGIAANGIEAVTAWRDEAWDLILMDCAMPEMDGYQATATIRSLEAGTDRHIPIVAMTANVQSSDIERCLAAGMDDHLGKPLTLEVLTECLDKWLRQPVRRGETTMAASGEEGGALDEKILERLRDMLGASLGDAIRPFLEDMPRYLRQMEEAIAGDDATTLRQVSHVIKGAASNLGATALAAVARELELHAEAGALRETGELLLRLKTEFAIVEPRLLVELDEPAGNALPQIEEDAPVVLVVDDDRSTRSALRHALHRSGFRVEEAGNGAGALAWLESNAADAILMDALMPEMDGFAACRELKQQGRWKDIPVLMITALEDRQSIERAFEAGASDFIPKPIHLSVVNQRVRRVIDATRAERHVRHLAYNDTLTGLPNRLFFVDQLSRAIECSQANNSQLAVLFLDLDRFKFINDTLGHEAGDQLLTTMAQRLKGCVRADDCVARLGGDEFTVLLADLPNAAVAASVAQNICRTVSAPLLVGGQETVITASVGISIFPADGTDVSTLLRHADTAMYRAKQTGSGFCYYEAAMESAISDRLRMENDLRRALDRDEITVFYQPVIDTITGEMTGVEALVRWLHPEQGIIQPASFIGVAEETGLILPLGERVLRMACQQARAWLDAGQSNLHVAVNLSARQLEQPNLREIILAALSDSELPPSALVLEITESVLMARANDCIDLLRDLRRLGIRLSIDDFGTGYSSLAYLKHLPANTLKIDRSFIQDIPDDDDAVAIVTGILALAHSLRMKVVAEGVETEAQQEQLARLNCDYLQGYLFSRPVPAEVIETRLLTPQKRKRGPRQPG